MPDLPDSQKRISQRYSGNLGYFRRPHYLRSLRFWLFTLTAVTSVIFAFTFQKWGTQKLYNTGPISENHASLENNCQACHVGVDKSFSEFLNTKTIGALLTPVSLKAMDEACIRCHPSINLHAPQMAGLTKAKFSNTISTVHATSCASCHREHTSHQRISPPVNQVCTDCHNDAQKLIASIVPPSSTAHPSDSGANVDLGDALNRYIAPPRKTDVLPAFASFAEGHPEFGYERPKAKDPADLKFNHARHLRSDMPLVDNKRLECASCHQPEPNGVFYQPVRYANHCQQCHSLQIQPSLPNLHIPHGDPAKVRLFLASLDSSFTESFRANGIVDPVELARRVEGEKQALRLRGLFTLQDLENRVFLQGDPQNVPEDRLMRSGNPKFLTECAKCHTVTEGNAEQGPQVQPPNIAQRWLLKGSFTHQPHSNMNCADCHGGAAKSKLTSDILLPSQQSCTECHHPQTAQKEGVKSACQSCHHFHSTAGPVKSGASVLKLSKPISSDRQP